jgi:FemAB-related protein (PEP-CTERM system-associated)
MRVERVEAPADEWDAFAETRGGCLGHAEAWARALADGYGIEPLFLAARDARGEVRGVLPLARFRSLFGKRTLVSLPFLDAAGVLSDGPEAEEALLEAVRAYGCDVELRQRLPIGRAPVGETSRVDLFLPLAGDVETRWRALPGKVRNQVRKAQKHLVVESADGDVHEFHRLHCARMRELGAPPHAERFLRAVAAGFGDRVRVLLARRAGEPIGGLFAIRFGSAVYVPWASALHSERHLCANQLLYWEAVRWATEALVAEFDFGRSPRGSGTYAFKRGWGAVERPLHWTCFQRDGRVTSASSSADSPVLQQLSALWRKLPAGLCDRVGPALRQRIAS